MTEMVVRKVRRNLQLLRRSPSLSVPVIEDYEMDEVRVYVRVADEFYEKHYLDDALKHLKNAKDILDMVMHREPPPMTREEYNELVGGMNYLAEMMRRNEPSEAIWEQSAGIDGRIWLRYVAKEQ